jgi:hypothetical protein
MYNALRFIYNALRYIYRTALYSFSALKSISVCGGDSFFPHCMQIFLSGRHSHRYRHSQFEKTLAELGFGGQKCELYEAIPSFFC